MVDDVRRVALCRRHVERIKHNCGVKRVPHGPADDAPAAHIEDDGEIEKARRRRDVRDIRDLQLIRRGRAEVATDKIGREW